MKFRDRVASWFMSKNTEDQLASALSLLRMQSVPSRNSLELIQAYKKSPWLQAVVKKISQRFAAVEWQLFVRSRGGQALKVPNVAYLGRETRKDMLLNLKQNNELVEITSHPFLDLMHRANPIMSGAAARALTQTYRDIKGEAFWALTFDGMGVPVGYWPVPPYWVKEIPSDDKPVYMLHVGGRPYQLPEESVIWFKDIDPADPYGRGIGTAESLSDELETDEFAAQFLKTFFYNRGKPEMIVALKGAKQDQVDEARRRWDNTHLGHLRAHQTHWTNADIEVKELTQKFDDMQMTELRQWERDTIINVFGVPPEQLGIVTNSNRATAFESESIMTRSVLVPRLEAAREQLQEELVSRYDERLILDYVSPVPSDKEFHLKAMEAAPWAPTRGEWRELQGLENRGDMDRVHLQPSTIESTKPEDEGVVDESEEASLSEINAKDIRKTCIPIEKATDVVAAAVGAMRPEMLAEELIPVWEDRVVDWANRSSESVGGGSTFTLQNPLVVEHLEEFSGDRVKEITTTTQRRAAKTLAEGVAAGESIDDLAIRLSESSGFTRARARTIARTEVLRSSTFADQTAWTQSGLVSKKQWIHSLLPNERVSHISAHEQIVELAEPFVVGGLTAMAPGQFGLPEEDVNCRCGFVPIAVSDVDLGIEQLSISEEQHKKIIKNINEDRDSWEDVAVNKILTGFDKQIKAAVVVLERSFEK